MIGTSTFWLNESSDSAVSTNCSPKSSGYGGSGKFSRGFGQQKDSLVRKIWSLVGAYRTVPPAGPCRHGLAANRIIFWPKKLANPTIQLSGYADRRRHSSAALNDTVLSDVDRMN